jgi:hypothetical protein
MRYIPLFALGFVACASTETVQPTAADLCDGTDAAELSFAVGWGNIRTTAHFLYGQPALIIDGHCDFWAAWGDPQTSFQELRRGHLDEATQQRVARELRVVDLGELGSDMVIADGPAETLVGLAGRVECARECQSSERKVVIGNARTLLEELWAHGDSASDGLSVAADAEPSGVGIGTGTSAEWPADSDLVSLADAHSGQNLSNGVEVEDGGVREELRALRDRFSTSYFEVSSARARYSALIRDELPQTLKDSALKLQSAQTR